MEAVRRPLSGTFRVPQVFRVLIVCMDSLRNSWRALDLNHGEEAPRSPSEYMRLRSFIVGKARVVHRASCVHVHDVCRSSKSGA